MSHKSKHFLNVNYADVQKYLDDNPADTFRSAYITLQHAGVAEISFSRSEGPFKRFYFKNIMVTEAHELILVVKPRSVIIVNADAVDASKWWKELQEPFGGDLTKLKFKISVVRDDLKLNMGLLTPLVKEVVAKLASSKPNVLYIKPTENSLEIHSVVRKTTSAGETYNARTSFEIEFVGDWHWRYTFAKLLAEVLPGQYQNLSKVYLVFGYECLNCMKRVFKEMNWTFPESHEDAKEFMNTAEGHELLSFDTFVRTRKNYNEFTVADTKTKIRFFFQQGTDPAQQPGYQRYQSLAGPAC